MARKFIENIRNRFPYIRRLHTRINDLQHRLAAIEAVPELRPPSGSQDDKNFALFREFLRLLQPYDVVNARKQRFGCDADGGYVMLDDFGPARTALSLGIGPDVSWDIDVARRGLQVLQFDPTIDGPPRANPRFVFSRRRVVGRHQMPGDITLSEILARPELASDNDLIAKIDIDGCEWEMLEQTDLKSLSRIRQMAIEFHDLRKFVDPSWRATASAALKNLMNTHVCFHIHGNNWGPFTVIGGIAFPSDFETSFARRGDYACVPSTTEFPTEFDRPCNPQVADLYLGRWNY